MPLFVEEISEHCWRLGMENGRWFGGLSCLAQ